MATVLAKRLLEDNFSKVDKRVLHEIFASCNNSFEDTVKTLQESLSDDSKVFSESGRAQREQALLDRAKRASLQVSALPQSALLNFFNFSPILEIIFCFVPIEILGISKHSKHSQ